MWCQEVFCFRLLAFCTLLVRRQSENYPNKPPSIHEILDSSKPSRIYFDVDYKLSNQDDDERDHGKDERARAFLGGFLDHIKESIIDMFGIIDDPDILVLDATTPSKISYHIIVDIFVQDICTVKEIVHTIKATYSDDLDLANELVDMAVYNHNRGMRVAWSSKENKKEGVLYPLAYVQSGDDDNTDTGSTISIQRVTEYDPEMMFKSLIQCLVDKNQIMTHIFKDKHAINARQYRTESSFGGIPTSQIPTNLLEAFIKQVHGEYASINSPRLSDFFFQCVIVKGRCPFIKDVHKSNNQFLNVNMKTNRAWFTCSDVDCPSIRYLECDIRFALTSEWPWQVKTPRSTGHKPSGIESISPRPSE